MRDFVLPSSSELEKTLRERVKKHVFREVTPAKLSRVKRTEFSVLNRQFEQKNVPGFRLAVKVSRNFLNRVPKLKALLK